jgi:hypothetical protein
LNQDVVPHDQGDSIQIDAEIGPAATLINDDYLDYANYGSESFLSEADGSDLNEAQVEWKKDNYWSRLVHEYSIPHQVYISHLHRLIKKIKD